MKRNFSSKSFGIFLALVLLILASFLWQTTDHYFQYEAVILAGSLLVLLVSFLAPHLLSKPADLWYYTGQGIAKITNPLILGVLFFGVVTPTSIICKLFARNVLKLKAENCSSYWTEREHKKFSQRSFKQQF